MEAVVAGHPVVAACAVVGVPDERRGEIPVAVIVPRRGERVSARSVMQYCRERIAAYKVPREVYSAAALPLGPTGKVLKAEVREQVLTGLIPQASGRGDVENGRA